MNTMSRLSDALIRARAEKAERDGRKVTQREVATALEVPDVYVSRWETGRNVPERYAIHQLAAFYEVDEAELMALRDEAVAGGDGRRAGVTSRGAAQDRRRHPMDASEELLDAAGAPPAHEVQGPSTDVPRSGRGRRAQA